jgi:hypothetical protein
LLKIKAAINIDAKEEEADALDEVGKCLYFWFLFCGRNHKN